MSSAERVAPQSQLNRGAELYALIRAEYREMPGLRLTLSQAARLWSADPKTCARALNALVEIGFLCSVGGTYMRADCERRCA
jgi:hypothetical protein